MQTFCPSETFSSHSCLVTARRYLQCKPLLPVQLQNAFSIFNGYSVNTQRVEEVKITGLLVTPF